MNRVFSLTALVLASALLLPPTAHADWYNLQTTVSVPNMPASVDLAWVDPATHRYYITDRTNAGIDVVNTATNAFEGRILGFSGVRGSTALNGPNGVLVISETQELWTGDGDSTTKVVDLRQGKVVNTISTGGKGRADELGYDPKDKVILIANDKEDVPFLTFISATTKQVIGKVDMPEADGGIEQPIYNPTDGMFYVTVPSNKVNANGEIAVLDPMTLKLVRTMALTATCDARGLALGPSQNLLVGCGNVGHTLIVNATSGQLINDITQVGGEDQVTYNPGDKRFYIGASNHKVGGVATGAADPVLGVVDAVTNQWLMNIPTSSQGGKVAADPGNNRVFVPMTGQGIGVFVFAPGATPPAPPALVPQAPAPPAGTGAAGGAAAPAALPNTGEEIPALPGLLGLGLMLAAAGLGLRRRAL